MMNKTSVSCFHSHTRWRSVEVRQWRRLCILSQIPVQRCATANSESRGCKSSAPEQHAMHYVRKIFTSELISIQPPRSILSSSVVTLSRPPTISSLKITDRSFRYASPHLWNQLPDSFRQPHHSCLDSPPHPLINSSLSSSPLSSSITPSLFHSRLKIYLFNKSFPP